MEDVTVDKSKLLEILKKNRKEHHEAFVEAQKGYRAATVIELSRILADAKAGKKIENCTGLSAPDDFTQHYDTVIAMAEMSVATELTLTSHEFQQYVLNKWSWSHGFSSSCSSYSTIAKTAGKLIQTNSSKNG